MLATAEQRVVTHPPFDAARCLAIIHSASAQPLATSPAKSPIPPRPLDSVNESCNRLCVQDLLAYARLTTEIGPRSPSTKILKLHLLILTARLRRAFHNLIGNAIKYRKPNQPVKVHISAVQTEEMWAISVRDDGIGFDNKDAAAIFAPFKRLHPASQFPGTGVGLAICRRIVEAQGGRIWAEARPGEGATFSFLLPVQSLAALRHTAPIDSPKLAATALELEPSDPRRH